MLGFKFSPLGPQNVKFLGYFETATPDPVMVSNGANACDTFELATSSSGSSRGERPNKTKTLTKLYMVEHPLLDWTYVLASPDASGALRPLEGDALQRFALSAAIFRTPDPVNPDVTTIRPDEKNVKKALVPILIAMNIRGQGPLHYNHFVRTALSSGSEFDYDLITTWILTEINEKLEQANAIIPTDSTKSLPKALAAKVSSLLQEILHPNFGYLRVLDKLKEAEKLSAPFETSIITLSAKAKLLKNRLDATQIFTPASLANEETLAEDYSIYDDEYAVFLQLSDQIGKDSTAHAKAYAMQEVGMIQEQADLERTAQNLMGSKERKITFVNLLAASKLIDRFLVTQVRFERNSSGDIDVILDFDLGHNRSFTVSFPHDSLWMKQILQRFNVTDPRALFGKEMYGHERPFKIPLIFGIHDLDAYKPTRKIRASISEVKDLANGDLEVKWKHNGKTVGVIIVKEDITKFLQYILNPNEVKTELSPHDLVDKVIGYGVISNGSVFVPGFTSVKTSLHSPDPVVQEDKSHLHPAYLEAPISIVKVLPSGNIKVYWQHNGKTVGAVMAKEDISEFLQYTIDPKSEGKTLSPYGLVGKIIEYSVDPDGEVFVPDFISANTSLHSPVPAVQTDRIGRVSFGLEDSDTNPPPYTLNRWFWPSRELDPDFIFYQIFGKPFVDAFWNCTKRRPRAIAGATSSESGGRHSGQHDTHDTPDE